MNPGGSSPVTTTTNNQTAAPWGPAQAPLQALMGTALSDYGAGANMGAWQGDPSFGGVNASAWQDPNVAPQMGAYVNALTSTAQDPSVMAPVIAGQNLATQQMTPDAAGNVGMTPGLNAAIGGLGQAGQQYGNIYNTASNINPFQQSVLDQAANQVSSSMSGAGRYGSGAYDKAIAAGIAPTMMSEYDTAQGRRLAATGGQAGVAGQEANVYNQGLARAGQFAQLSPTLAQARFIPANALGQVADIYSNVENARLNAMNSYWNQQRDLPLQMLGQAAGDIIPGAGLGGTRSSVGTSTTQVPFGQRALGGAIAGAGLGSAFGPWGSAAGAGLGGAAGAFL